MSAEELEALIENISTDRQRCYDSCDIAEVLLNAGSMPSATQSVAQLPLEIFVNCLDLYPQPRAIYFPMLFLNICSAWTRIALSTPELWAAIDLNGDLTPDLPSLMNTWFKRASTHTLPISSHSGGWQRHLTADTVAVIAARTHAYRVKELDTRLGSRLLIPLLFEGAFRALRTIIISEGASASDVMQILRSLPHLVECNISEVYDANHELDMLVLPHLQHPEIYAGRDDILKYLLTLPGLKTLSFPWEFIPPPNLHTFLARSLPPLTQMNLGSYRQRREGRMDGMEEFFSLLPMLTNLKLSNPYPTTAVNGVDILEDSPHLLPNLTSLTFEFRHRMPVSSWYEELHRALSARCIKLCLVRVLLKDAPEEADFRPTQEVMGGLKQLVASGMKIYIGPEEQSLV